MSREEEVEERANAPVVPSQRTAVSSSDLGQLLLRRGSLTAAQLEQALDEQRMHGGRLGDRLLMLGHVTRDQISAALAEQARLRPQRLGDLLVAQGVISGDDLTAARAEQQRHGGRLGQALRRLDLVSDSQITQVLEQQFGTTFTMGTATRLGDLLVEREVVTPTQVDEAVAAQRSQGGPLGSWLVLQGSCSRLEIRDAVAAQYGLPTVDLVADPPDPSLILGSDPEVLLAETWLAHHQDEDRLVVATYQPPSMALLTEIRDATGATDVGFLITTKWDIDQAVAKTLRAELSHVSSLRLDETLPEQSAARGFKRWQKLGAVATVLLLLGGVFVWPRDVVVLILFGGNLLFFFGFVFKFTTSLFGLFHVRNRDLYARYADQATPQIPAQRNSEADVRQDRDLPTYTVLLPVFDEANIITKLIDHLGQLDYPKNKLQVLLLLEETDEATIRAAKNAQCPEYVRILVVPEGSPQTKPRACNYGLSFASGEFLVIYDAEDMPDAQQLRRLVEVFDSLDPDVICVQAALNFFNTDQNILTRMFAIEYSAWFDAMLPGLDQLRLPIPLGGTSNHFRTEELRRVGAWDPYNVTEDADLGLRTEALGYRVKTATDSTTWEEACSRVPAWIKQRTRWIKGYMVTALVHTRHPLQYMRSTGIRGMVGLLGLIAGTPLMFLAYPFVWLVTILGSVNLLTVSDILPGWLLAAGAVSMVVGNLGAIAVGAIAASTRHGWRIAGYALLNPFYWLLHSIAAWRALFQMLRNPFTWEKTPHGLEHEEVVPQ